MSVGGSIETVGENLEFGVASASNVTIYFTGGAGGTNTSANDTATDKYTDSYGTVKGYEIRTTQSIQIISINGIAFTDPISIIANTHITEKLDSAIITKIEIRTITANTNIKIRVRGR